MDAVRAYDRVAPRRAAVGKPQRRAAPIGLHGDAPRAEPDRVAETFARGRQQQHQQGAAMDADLRPAIAGVQPAILAPHFLAITRRVEQCTRRDAGGEDRLAQAEFGKLAHGMRQQVDADAERLRVRCRLVQFDRNAGVMQGNRKGQATDSAAGNDHAHGQPSLPGRHKGILRSVQSLNDIARPAAFGILSGTVSYGVKRAYLRVIRDLEQPLAPLGYTPPLLAALAIVAANPGIAPARLADAMGHGRSRAAPLLDRLEALGHIRRAAGVDSRGLELCLTQEGQAMLARLGLVLAAHERRIRGDMPSAEARTLARSLERIARPGAEPAGAPRMRRRPVP